MKPIYIYIDEIKNHNNNDCKLWLLLVTDWLNFFLPTHLSYLLSSTPAELIVLDRNIGLSYFRYVISANTVRHPISKTL